MIGIGQDRAWVVCKNNFYISAFLMDKPLVIFHIIYPCERMEIHTEKLTVALKREHVAPRIDASFLHLI